jgi:hypothetical protein
MPVPQYSAGTYGTPINSVTVAAGKTIAAFLDLSAVIEGQLNCEIVTGGCVPTVGTVFSAYRAYAAGGSPPITLTSAVSIGATSAQVNSNTGLHPGQLVGFQQVGGSKLGEVVTVSAISGTGSPYTLTISPLVNTYNISDAVYYMGQTPVFSVTPSSPTGTWVVNKDYSSPMYLGTGQYIIAAANTDPTVSVTVSITNDRVTSYV